jgi:ParB family chromosome partitioning protein
MRAIPVSLIDPSPFETRERVDPIQDGEVLTPLVVRQKADGRFEVVAGHRRLKTLIERGVLDAPCRVRELTDERAALMLFRDNQDRRDLSDFERGLFFKKCMAAFGFTETEVARWAGTSANTVSLCLSIVRSRAAVLVHTKSPDPALYAAAVTTNKAKAVNSLPRKRRGEALAAVVENGLTTEETKDLVSGVREGKTVDEATTEVVNRRETRKAERHAEKQRRVKCPACHGKGWVLRSEKA